MTDNKDVFDQLDDEERSLKSRKQLLLEHLQSQLKRQKSHPEQSQDIAYGIAGLMATHTAQLLDEDDPYMEALLMAGQLELPEEHQDQGASWKELHGLVQKLSQ
jgi:hypothetical protein